MGSNLEVRLLGPLEVVSDGAPVVVAAPKQRALLAVLALDGGRVVPSDELADRLWAGEPPATAVTTVQVYVSQLRKLVGAERIVTRRPGYFLDVATDAVDVGWFEALAARGRSLLAEDEFGLARCVLEEGLSLWRGAALAEFVFEDWAAAPARRLEEVRVAVREDLLDAKLGLGLSRELVGELEALVGEFPLRERLRGQLMLALYRAGRQADALAGYQEARHRLVEELGIDPSPSLVELERRILQQDPTLGTVATPMLSVAPSAAPFAPDSPDLAEAEEHRPDAAQSVAMRRERKVVSVLFCDLVDFTATAEVSDPEDVEALLDRYYTAVRGEVERFGGTIEKFIGDAVMAVFGAPVAREDDPERAVRAALAIIERAASLRDEEITADLEVRLGVTTGEALVKLDADGARGEAMVSGDVVNTAARLQAAAPTGGVLVDEMTHEGARDRIRFGASREVRAKGKSRPVRAWLPLEARPVATEVEGGVEVPMVGRVRELETLVNALDRARDEESAQLVSLRMGGETRSSAVGRAGAPPRRAPGARHHE